MGSRLELHEEFCEILGSRNAYFQSPGQDRMVYPAIKYQLGKPRTIKADNKNYLILPEYEVIIIDSNPDSQIWLDVMNRFQHCSFNRFYRADNLNHWSLTIHY